MAVALEDDGRPFRVPGYAGYVPGLKYSFGHTYGYVESQLFKSQHPTLKKSCPNPNGVQRRVQWRSKSESSDASVQCDGTKRRSAATQWSGHRTLTAATQWLEADLPGRQQVNPEKGTLLTNFHPQAEAGVPISRHTFALQQTTNEGTADPYFDNRPPSTYLNNYPISGYQGFVPRVRTSTSSLGIRYMKAVERSLQALHEQKQHSTVGETQEEVLSSPQKLIDKRPLHTPRHRPHPRQQPEDWRIVYKGPPSTYRDASKTFIPGYKGFIPHLRGSPNMVGLRYSKAALKCLEQVQHPNTMIHQDTEKEIEIPNFGGDTDSDRAIPEDSRRPSRERHPIPGYQGFIPRLRDSPTTLGLRYSKAALEDQHRSRKQLILASGRGEIA